MFNLDVSGRPSRAFNAGPRRDPLVYEQTGAKRSSVYDRNLFGTMTVQAQGPRSVPSGSLLLPSAADPASLLTGRVAGAAHEQLGMFAQHSALGSRHFELLGQGRTEEERRQLLITGERRRRGAHLKHQPTDTLGLQHQQEQQSAAEAAGWYCQQPQLQPQPQPQQQQAARPATLSQEGSDIGTRSKHKGPYAAVQAMPMVATAASPQQSAAALAAIYLATHKPFAATGRMR